jgi:hypothetical protein
VFCNISVRNFLEINVKSALKFTLSWMHFTTQSILPTIRRFVVELLVELEWILEGGDCRLIEVLCRHISGGSEENQDSRRRCRGFISARLE